MTCLGFHLSDAKFARAARQEMRVNYLEAAETIGPSCSFYSLEGQAVKQSRARHLSRRSARGTYGIRRRMADKIVPMGVERAFLHHPVALRRPTFFRASSRCTGRPVLARHGGSHGRLLALTGRTRARFVILSAFLSLPSFDPSRRRQRYPTRFALSADDGNAQPSLLSSCRQGQKIATILAQKKLWNFGRAWHSTANSRLRIYEPRQ